MPEPVESACSESIPIRNQKNLLHLTAVNPAPPSGWKAGAEWQLTREAFLHPVPAPARGLTLEKTFIMTACGIGFLVFLAYILNRDFPAGLLQEYMELAWPLSGR